MTFRKSFILILLSVFFAALSFSQSVAPEHQWRSIGPHALPIGTADSGQWTANGVGWIESLALAKNKEKRLYAGSNVGGLWMSNNGGESWEFRFDVERICGVWDILMDGKSKRKLWVATGTNTWDNKWGHGILYSKNSGKSWRKTSLSFTPNDAVCMYGIERSIVNKKLFFACSTTDVYRSTDKTKTWENVLDHDNKARMNFRHLLTHNSNQDRAVVSGSELFLTTDQGATWHPQSSKFSFQKDNNLRDSLPTRFAVSLNPQNNDQLMVVYNYNRMSYIDRSDDFGMTWYNVLKNRDFDRVDINHAEIAWHPSDSNVIFVGSVRLYKSINQGKSFDLVSNPAWATSQFMHDDIRSITFSKNENMWVGNDGGISYSTDTAKSWMTLYSHGLTASQFYDIAVDNGRVVGGCQDMSTMIYQNNTWYNTSVVYGDGGVNLIMGDTLFIMQNGMRIRRGTFANENWDVIYTPFRPNRFKYPFVKSPLDATKIWAADHDIWELGQNKRWANRTKDVPHGFTKIVALDVSDKTGKTVYFAKDQPTWNPAKEGMVGKLYKGTYDTENYKWNDITANLSILAWREITSIVSNPNNPDEVYVSFYGFDDGESRHRVYRSIDGGSTWSNFSEGLPNLNALKLLPVGKEFVLFLATDEGVFYRPKQATSWIKLTNGFINAHIMDIEYDVTNHTLYAATFGNGVWLLPLDFIK